MAEHKPLFPINPEGLDDIARELLENGVEDASGQPVNIGANINLADYIQVPGVKGINGNPVVISKFEIAGMNGEDYEQTHKEVLQQQGIYVPTPAIFMPHVTNVVITYHNNGTLLDGKGNSVSRAEHEDIYRHLTTNHIAVYGQGTQEGAWTWLNGKFVGGTGFNDLDLETVVGIDRDGNLLTRREPLKSHTRGDDVLVNLAWNSQGLPRRKLSSKKYDQGKNIFFYEPVDGGVAGFYAGSGGAGLDCDGVPSNSSVSLGVFACAEGAAPENSGANK